MGCCWSGLKELERYGLKSWIEAAKEAVGTTTVLAIALANKLCPHRLGGAG